MMRRAQIRRALTVCAFVPLAAWAADEDQAQTATQSQTPTQSQSPTQNQTPAQNPLENQSPFAYQNPNSPLGQLPTSQYGSENQLPASRNYLFATGGLGQTDNVALTPSGQSQTLATVGGVVDVARQGAVFNGFLKGQLDYLYYVEHAYPGQFIGRLDGEGSWAIVQDHIKWVLQEDFGNAQVNALAAPNRNNVESVNVVSTGPDFLMRPTQTMFLQLGARYQLSTWQTSPNNSQRLLATGAIGEELSLASSVSLNADVTSVRFQDPTLVNPDYDRRKFYLHYDLRGVRTSLALAAGVAQVDENQNGGTWQSVLLAQLLLTRDVSPFQSVFMSAGQQYTDAADSFAALTGGAAVNSGAAGSTILAPPAGTGGNYLNQYFSGGWNYRRGRSSFGVSGRWDRDTYTIEATPQQIQDYINSGVAAPLNVERWSVEARAERVMTPRMSADIHLGYLHEDYWTVGYVDHTVLAGVGLTYTVNSKLQYRLKYDHNVRTVVTFPVTTTAVAPGYTENVIFLTVAYQLTE
jgi:hypothetical protein